MLIAPYDSFSKPSSIELFSFDILTQIIDLPDGYHGMVQSIALGGFVDSEPSSFDFQGNLFRVRVRLHVCKSLKKATSLVRGGKREIFSVKYERLQDWCQVYGMTGHQFKEHRDAHPPSTVF